MQFALIFIVLLTSTASFAAWNEPKCKTALIPNESSRLIFGQASSINLSLLRNYETISESVLEAFNEKVAEVEQPTRRQSHALALAFHENPTRENRERLFRATQILVPIAVRHLLAKLSDPDSLEDYFQTGNAALWQHLRFVEKIPRDKLESVFYWEGVLNGLRAQIFANMRSDFRQLYSLTPAKLAKTTEFTFEEEILIFGETPELRTRIAELYGRSIKDAEKEWRVQTDSVVHNTALAPEPSDPEAVTVIQKSLRDADAKRVVSQVLATLDARHERAVRLHLMLDKTLAEAGEELGVSPERIRQMIVKSLRLLKHPVRERVLASISPLEGEEGNAAQSYRDSDVRLRARLWEEGQQSRLEAARVEKMRWAIKLRIESESAYRLAAIRASKEHVTRLNRVIASLNDLRKTASPEVRDLRISLAQELRDELSEQRRFVTELGTTGDPQNYFKPEEAEAALIQDRQKKWLSWQIFEASLSKRFDRAEAEIARYKNQGEQRRLELLPKQNALTTSIASLRSSLTAIQDLQFEGNENTDLESSRERLSELLRTKEAELKNLDQALRHSADSTDATVRTVVTILSPRS